jgi:MFS family permease
LLIAGFGHIRAFAVFAATTSAATLAFAIDPDARIWIALRFITGFCSAGLFTVAESWLNDMTPSAARGRVVSFYMLFNKMAFAGGQLLLLGGEVAGFGFFMIASACYSLSLVPVALNTAASPKAPRVAFFSVVELVRIAPAGTVGCFVAGLVNTAVLNIAPVYLGGVGQSTDGIAWLLASMQIGSLLLQWPLGWLSDRVDRRIVIAIASGAVALASLLIATLGHLDGTVLVGLFALWGGFGLSIYAICIAHANDFVERSEVVRLSSGLLLAWAAGSVIGPTLATLLMDALGAAMLFYYAAVISAGLTGFVLWRMTRRAARPASEREPFVGLPPTSPALAELDPRGPGRDAPG